MSCTKTNVDSEFSEGLEQRGNDNHKIWNLAQIDKHYTYSFRMDQPALEKGLISMNIAVYGLTAELLSSLAMQKKMAGCSGKMLVP
ncbi:MAG: hypothetical protein IPO25_08215 [Saprospiraceae bacterium]|nr:hypothetical protein [Saprospiraceae bacterium]